MATSEPVLKKAKKQAQDSTPTQTPATTVDSTQAILDSSANHGQVPTPEATAGAATGDVPIFRFGVTGTRYAHKLLPPQRQQLRRVLHLMGELCQGQSLVLHQGVCTGGDEFMAQACREEPLFKGRFAVHGHPPTDHRFLAKGAGGVAQCDTVSKEYGYLVRNQHIVDRVVFIIGLPDERKSSGTRYTLAMAARAQHAPVILVIEQTGEIVVSNLGSAKGWVEKLLTACKQAPPSAGA